MDAVTSEIAHQHTIGNSSNDSLNSDADDEDNGNSNKLLIQEDQ